MKSFSTRRKTQRVVLTSLMLSVTAFSFGQLSQRESSWNARRQANSQVQAENSQAENLQKQQQEQDMQRRQPQAAGIPDPQRTPDIQRAYDNRQREYQRQQEMNRAGETQSTDLNRQRENQRQQHMYRAAEIQRMNDNRQREYQRQQELSRAADIQWSLETRQREYQRQQQERMAMQGSQNRSYGNYDNKQREYQRQQSRDYREPDYRQVYGGKVYSPVITNRGSNCGNNIYRPRAYTRPPVIWGGNRYYSNYDYAYHPYRPRYYGESYHPLGFFMTSLGANAREIMFDNRRYRYDQGVYYEPYNNGYRAVFAPAGASLGRMQLPFGYSTIDLDGDTFYYYAGTFYAGSQNGYTVMDAPPGAVVYDLPEGCTEFRAGNINYLQYNHAVFQPIVLNGRNAYEVVELGNDRDDQ